MARDEAIEIESQMIPKAQLEMKINDEQIEEEVTFLVLSSRRFIYLVKVFPLCVNFNSTEGH